MGRLSSTGCTTLLHTLRPVGLSSCPFYHTSSFLRFSLLLPFLPFLGTLNIILLCPFSGSPHSHKNGNAARDGGNGLGCKSEFDLPPVFLEAVFIQIGPWADPECQCLKFLSSQLVNVSSHISSWPLTR